MLLVLATAVIALGPASGARAEPALVEVGDARLSVALDGDEFAIGRDSVIEWVRRSATIVAGYYGTFPVRTLEVRILAVDGATVRNGRTLPTTPPRIHLGVGRDVSAAALVHDWVLVHEMVHLALPEVGDEHAWLAEGLATYVEGIARVQAGNLTADELWQENFRDMPKGLPGPDDAGLDRTHTWARTYWGGALFCLEADVTIRERTANRRGLQDSLRAVALASGGMVAEWPIERVFQVGDTATATSVLTDLYSRMRSRPAAPDLAALWRRLGVEWVGGRVRLTNGAPEAAVREAITRTPATSPGSDLSRGLRLQPVAARVAPGACGPAGLLVSAPRECTSMSTALHCRGLAGVRRGAMPPTVAHQG